MRYHIDTIPLWDALKLQGECPLCAIRRKNELLEVQRYLGASVMEPDTRIEVNVKGFCCRHLEMLFEESNRLGLGLMMHTHLKETRQRLESVLKQMDEAAHMAAKGSSLQRFFKKSSEAEELLSSCAEEIGRITGSCILCDSLNENVARYFYTFHHLWKTDGEFRSAVKQSKGFCLPDTQLLLKTGVEQLHGELLGELVETLADLSRSNLDRIEKELEWFTLKFDYRNQDKPWGESRNAVERTCNKLRGWCVGEEPNPKDT